MHFQGYASLKEQQSAKGQAIYNTGMQMLQDANREARRLISGIRSPTLDESGLVVAIEYLVQDQTTRQGPAITFHSDVRFDRLDPVLENAIYRIAQEALANACVHSGSKKVDVSLVQEDDTVCLKIRDWGRGFDPDTVAEERFGLEGIRERTRLLGGQLSIESHIGEGTCLRAVVPLLEPQ